jgi:hypothetical protein
MRIHPQPERITTTEYIVYMRRVLQDVQGIEEAYLCALDEADRDKKYEGISLIREPLPPEKGITALGIKMKPACSSDFPTATASIHRKFAADNIPGPVVFDVSRSPRILKFLRANNAFPAWQKRESVALDSFEDLAKDLFRTIAREPVAWNALAVYWYKWRTTEIVRAMRADNGSRLHVHVPAHVDAVPLVKKLLLVADNVTLWHAGPLSPMTYVECPSPHPADDIGSHRFALGGIGRALPASAGILLRDARAAIERGRIFYSPLALVHAPPRTEAKEQLALGILSDWMEQFDREHAPAAYQLVHDFEQMVGTAAWEETQKGAEEVGPLTVIDGWPTRPMRGKAMILDGTPWPVDQVIRWEAEISAFCTPQSSYAADSSTPIDAALTLSVRVPYLENIPVPLLLRLMDEYGDAFKRFRGFLNECASEARAAASADAVKRLQRSLDKESQQLTERYAQIKKDAKSALVDVFVRNFTLALVLFGAGAPRHTMFVPAVTAIFDGLRERRKQTKEKQSFESGDSWLLWRLGNPK